MIEIILLSINYLSALYADMNRNLKFFIVATVTIGAILSLTGCSRDAGPISGSDLVSYAVEKIDEAGLNVDAAATRALCDTVPLDNLTKVEFVEGLVYLCKATQNYSTQSFGPKVQSVAVSLGKESDLIGECQRMSRPGSLGLANANRYYLTRQLTALELLDTSSEIYQLSQNPDGKGLRFVVRSGYLPEYFEAEALCADLVNYLEDNIGARVFVTFPALINEDGETLWVQAILAVNGSIVVYTNGDDEYDPTYFGLWTEMLARR